MSENRTKRVFKPLHRHLVEYRVLSILVMIFTGFLMWKVTYWVIDFPPNDISVNAAAVIGAVFAPAAAIFKFALDYALDGKIENPEMRQTSVN